MKAMRKMFVAMMMAVLLTVFVVSTAFAEPVVKMGLITSTTASVRSEPNTRATKYTSLKNGELVPITGETGEWYMVDLASVESLKGQMQGVGYILKTYVVTDSYYVTIQKSTKIYSSPWGKGPAVAEKVKGNQLLVLAESEYGDWLSVQLNDGRAGVGFLKKSDLGYPTYNYWYNGTWYCSQYATVMKDNLEVRAGAGYNQQLIGYLSKDTIVKKYTQPYNGYQSIEFNYNGALVVGYVPSLYLIDVYGN